MNLHNEFQKYLKDAALPFTEEREKIVNLISDMDCHFTVDELLTNSIEQELKISRATVYRTIQLLLDAELINKVSRRDQPPVYEPIFDKGRHNHMLCLSCGKIEDFSSPEIEKVLKVIADENGFNLYSYSVKIFGNCSGVDHS
jgi:Fur family ferric uptake transcriptional regulator